MADSQVQTYLAGPALDERQHVRGDHEEETREESDRAAEEACPVATTSAASRLATAAAEQALLPDCRLQAEQDRHAGQGRGDRVRPEPVSPHRAALLRRRREAVHDRAGRFEGRRHGRLPGPDRRSGSATRCRLRNIPIGTQIHNVELRRGWWRSTRSLGRHIGAVDGESRTTTRRFACRRAKCVEFTSTAWRRSDRSATSTTRIS